MLARLKQEEMEKRRNFICCLKCEEPFQSENRRTNKICGKCREINLRTEEEVEYRIAYNDFGAVICM